MDNVLYQKLVYTLRVAGDENYTGVISRTFIVLTEEVNRLIVWEREAVEEDETLQVLKTFPFYDRTAALEFAVDTARESIESYELNAKARAAADAAAVKS